MFSYEHFRKAKNIRITPLSISDFEFISLFNVQQAPAHHRHQNLKCTNQESMESIFETGMICPTPIDSTKTQKIMSTECSEEIDKLLAICVFQLKNTSLRAYTEVFHCCTECNI